MKEEENSTSKQSCDVMELFAKRKLLKMCAPMVRYSKLQFRSLVREYNCDLCFTPMIMADSFCKSSKARQNEFTTNHDDEPLIAQFAANTVHDFVGAAHMISPFCNGVDLNAGCPQRWAKQMGLGCALLDQPQLIYDIVRQCRNLIDKPFTVSVKMRLTKNLEKTVEISKQLEQCGVSFLTIHARTADHSSGPIDEDALKLIRSNLNVPLVANGAIKSLNDCYDLQEKTNCQGVMVANGILTNPALFTGAAITPIDCIQKWVDICDRNHTTFQCFHHHLVFMLEKILTRTQKKIFNNLQKFEDVFNFIKETFSISPQVSQLNPTEINYEERDNLYLRLKPEETEQLSDFSFDYSSDSKLFRTKIKNETECDWSDIFIENG